MIHRPVPEGVCQPVCILTEHPYLPESKFVTLRVFRCSEMRIYRLYANPVACAEKAGQLIKLSRHETEPVHACIKLDVYREVLDTPLFKHFAQSLESVHVRDARLEIVVNYPVKEIRSGSEYDYRDLNPCLAQFHAFNRVCHRKIISPGAFHKRSELHGTMPVCICLYKHQQLG